MTRKYFGTDALEENRRAAYNCRFFIENWLAAGKVFADKGHDFFW